MGQYTEYCPKTKSDVSSACSPFLLLPKQLASELVLVTSVAMLAALANGGTAP